MKAENQTRIAEFFIAGFSEFPHLRIPLFVIFFLIYLITLWGNLLIMSIIYYDSCLHTPMYFFITNLAFIDLSLTTNIFPKMLANIFKDRPYVTLKECLGQLHVFLAMEALEYVVLTAMAYDRYVAICDPLRYRVIMTKGLCCQLTAVAVLVGLITPIPFTVMLSALSYCESHKLNHFFCDMTALLKISCTNTQTIETLIYSVGTMVGGVSFFLILMSYMYIISIIMKIQSVQGRFKGMSTCVSHLTVVTLFCGSVIILYLRPTSMYSMNQNKMVSLVYLTAVPLLNPIIYSLNNKERREALKKSNRIRKNKCCNLLSTAW